MMPRPKLKNLVDDQFTKKFNSLDLNVWKSFKQIVFLGKCRPKNFVEIHMGVRPQTHLGGHQIFLPEKFVTAMTSPKKKKRSSPVSLYLFHYFWPKYAIKRVSKQILTFFFFFFFFFWRCHRSDKLFGKNVRTLTQIARKIKSCPKFLQPGGASAPHFVRLWKYSRPRV